MAESSKEGYGSNRVVLPMVVNMESMEIFPVLGYLMLMYDIDCSKGIQAMNYQCDFHENIFQVFLTAIKLHVL
jgi:hypothetical protein